MYTHPDRITTLVARATELMVDDESLFGNASVLRQEPLGQLPALMEHVGKFAQAAKYRGSDFDVHDEAVRIMAMAIAIAISTDPNARRHAEREGAA